MHWIRQHILIELTRFSQRRYSELRPDGVEGNLFLYHLDGLVKEGLVEKSEHEYLLTDEGRRLVTTLSLDTGKQRRQPLVLTAVALRNSEGQFLLFRWKREPNTGLISFPHGMVHYGERLRDMARLELAEKCGFEADLEYLGQAAILEKGGVARHWLVSVYGASIWSELKAAALRPEAGESFWGKLEDYAPEQFIPGFYELAKLADENELAGLVEINVKS